MTDGVARHAVDASRCVDLLDAVDAAELLSTDLPGRGFLIFTDGCEGKHAAGADSKHTADDALLSHAQADQGVFVTVGLEELHHRYVVGERGGGGDDLVVVGRDGQHLLERLFQPASGTKIVEGENQARTGAQSSHCFGLAANPTLQFQVQELASGGGGPAK